jgi:ParB-like chromosome segregation protein Spo0J
MEFHPLANIFPLIEGQAFDDLCADIRAHGVREPVWLYEGQILDGRNRWRAAAASGMTCPIRDYTGSNPLEFVLSLNLHRRQLNPGQLAVVGLRVYAWHAEQAAKRRVRKPADSVPANLPEQKGEASELAAKAVGASARNVRKAKRLQADRPDLLAKVEIAELSLHAATQQAAEETKKADLQRPALITLPVGLHHGDFRELSASIEDDSVDLIFTDPPYDGDSVQLYEDAARVASRILKPGASMIAYSGQRHLPAVLAGMSKHLRYWWTVAGVHEGGNQMMNKLGIRCGWKPLVWFVKGGRGDVQNVILDVVRGDREKDSHEWQQSEEEALHMIGKLSAPGSTVVDFFLGGGTTAVACKRLDRRFIGFEVNAASIERSAKRLAL